MSEDAQAREAWKIALMDSLAVRRRRHIEYDDSLLDLCRGLSREIFAKRPSTTIGRLHLKYPLQAETWIFHYEQLRHWNGISDDLSARRKSGTYFTPRLLIDPIVRYSLEPLTEAKGGLKSVRILDPACGAGAFLIAAGEFLSTHGPGKESIARKRAYLARECLKGIEIHLPTAEAARLAIRLWSGECGQIRVADTIEVFSQPRGTTNLQEELDAPLGFDAVVGNPPFANAIEDEFASSLSLAKAHREQYFPSLTGTADLSYYFLDLADRITKPTGRVGFVLPRAALATRSARGLRERLTTSRPPRMIFAPSDPLLFSQADVFVAGVVLGEPGTCLVSQSSKSPLFESRTVVGENWWSTVVGSTSLQVRRPKTQALKDRFHVMGSMTAGMAYELKAFVRESALDEKRARGHRVLRLVTTGLIDPNKLLWGEKRCRYLGCHYDRPVVDIGHSLPKSLRDRFQCVNRPKILVAGLSNRVEALLDELGNLAGAVSTYSIFEPGDDLSELRKLCDYLARDLPSRRLQDILGATALSGGRVTITKEFLETLPLPSELFR